MKMLGPIHNVTEKPVGTLRSNMSIIDDKHGIRMVQSLEIRNWMSLSWPIPTIGQRNGPADPGHVPADIAYELLTPSAGRSYNQVQPVRSQFAEQPVSKVVCERVVASLEVHPLRAT